MATEESVLFVYRTLPPHHYNARANLPKPTAFYLRPNEASLSVFAAGDATPRSLFQWYLNRVNADPSTAERKLRANGRTPEEMYQKGWRVAQVPVEIFEKLGLRVGLPRESDGHCDVDAESRETFEEAAAALADASIVLDREATLLQSP